MATETLRTKNDNGDQSMVRSIVLIDYSATIYVLDGGRQGAERLETRQ
jgi:hypothetical protein